MEDDELFYFAGDIAKPYIEKLLIYSMSTSYKPNGFGTIFKFFSNKALNQNGAFECGMYDVTVKRGKPDSEHRQRAKYVFNNVGDAMCDRMVIQNCAFQGKTIYKGDNVEAVNILFNGCTMSLGFDADDPGIVFDIPQCNDGFNVENCALSLTEGDTLLNCVSPLGGSTYKGTNDNNFNFTNCRIEFVQGKDYSKDFILCKGSYGKFNFTNLNLKSGGASGKIKTVINLFGMANANFNNVTFNDKLDIILPIKNNKVSLNFLQGVSARFENCQFRDRPNTKILFSNGESVPKDIHEVLTTDVDFRGAEFVDCRFFDHINDTLSWQILNMKESKTSIAKVNKVALHGGHQSLSKTFLLPPYQNIKSITVSGDTRTDSTANKFKITLAEGTPQEQSIVIHNINPKIKKYYYPIFEGSATTFLKDTTKHTVKVDQLNNDQVTKGWTAEVIIEYTALLPKVLDISTQAEKVYTKQQNTLNNAMATTDLPVLTQSDKGFSVYDLTKNKPIWWDGSRWVDSVGSPD